MGIAHRRLPLAAVGLLALPACVVSRSSVDAPTAPITSRTVTPVSAGSTEFASLIRGPGERVPAHDPDPGVMPRTFAASASEPAPNDSTAPPVPQVPLLPPPPPPDPPLVAAVRAYINDRPEEAIGHLNQLDKPNQDLMLQLIPAVVRLSQMDLTKAEPREMAILRTPLEQAVGTLALRGSLDLGKVCFCKEVNKFGRYEPYQDRHSFPPGGPLALYAEVRNIRCEPTKDPTKGDGYETKFAVEVRVVNEVGALVPLTDQSGRPVPVLQDVKQDFTRSPVQDCFVVFNFRAPTKPGGYGVRLEVRESSTGRTVTQTIKLRVH